MQRSKYLEANMGIYPNNAAGQEMVVTITGKLMGQGQVTNILAFNNKGHEVHLTANEKLRAEAILLKSTGL